MKILHRTIFIIPLLLIASFPAFSENEKTDNEAIATYRQNRAAFIEKKREADVRFNKKSAALDQEIASIRESISNHQKELSRLDYSLEKKRGLIALINGVQVFLSAVLFPIAVMILGFMGSFLGFGKGAGTILPIFMTLTAINVFLFIRYRQKPLYQKYRTLFIVALCILIVAIASPLLAGDLEKREKVMDQLQYAEKVLSLNDQERFIAILEAKVSRTVDLPAIASSNPLFKIFRRVEVDTPEYWFTLAALYLNEDKTGKAVDAVRKIVEENVLEGGSHHGMITINSIKFMIQQNQTEMAGKAVENLLWRIDDVNILLELADFLKESGMQVSQDKVLGHAINKADTVSELVDLSFYFFKSEENDKGTDALEQALDKAGSINDLVLVTTTAIEMKKDALVEKAAKKTGLLTKFSQRLQITDLLLKFERKEEAVAVFSDMIKDVTSSTPEKVEKLLFLIEAALTRNFLPQAIKATERLFMNLGKEKYNFRMEAGQRLASSTGLPNPDKITLPLFYGLLNEEIGYDDKAEDQYIVSITSSLESVLESYGYELPDSLNDYHLLGRIWAKENKGRLLSRLDRVYTLIETAYLKKQIDANTQNLSKLQLNLDKLKSDRERLLDEIQKKKSRIGSSSIKSAQIMISVGAVILLLVGILAGCVALSYQYAKSLSNHKAYGFISKLVETTGWARVFSILGVGSGMISVLVAQFFQILQMTHENSIPPLPVRVAAPPQPRMKDTPHTQKTMTVRKNNGK